MFVRPCWQPKSPADIRQIIDENPWALLVSQSDTGPLATNLPFLVEKAAGSDSVDELVLVSHIARANEHLAAMRQNTAPVLVIFEGPWSYVTASWYPDRQMPSTYYYTAVHCYGTIEFQEEPQLDHSLELLVNRMESSYPGGWKTSEIPRSEITRRFAGITGFRLRVSRVEAKFKLGQDEPLRDALAVADALGGHDAPEHRKLAAMIREQNAGRE
ncbi:FMN-binding negative transcriptional regulator [Silvibacterium sp.]|uniref:FMN-binding negative transcriptional regulator n=1 Tax=Silvibacterium sp. TaxID=1964179 RepID=UPI0039E6E0E8